MALELQSRLHRRRVMGEVPDTVVLAEHPHVYTLGRQSRPEHVLLDRGELTRRGIVLCEADRGGAVTYHGPGQLVVYPILNLGSALPDLHAYLRDLEEVMLLAARRLGVEARRLAGLWGVWAGGAKLGAVGAKVTRGVSKHGLALNVSTDLRYYEGIIPCGLANRAVTSLEQELGQPVEMEVAKATVVDACAAVFGEEPYVFNKPASA